MKNEALNVYEAFKKVLSESEAKMIVQYFENADSKAIEAAVTAKTESLATKEQVANVKAEIIKWMFIFWIGNVASVLAIIKFLID